MGDINFTPPRSAFRHEARPTDHGPLPTSAYPLTSTMVFPKEIRLVLHAVCLRQNIKDTGRDFTDSLARFWTLGRPKCTYPGLRRVPLTYENLSYATETQGDPCG
ncbi:hypothetical protein RSAG8_04549, partial [Rhizoctonia solani AG-8 WAC10335]